MTSLHHCLSVGESLLFTLDVCLSLFGCLTAESSAGVRIVYLKGANRRHRVKRYAIKRGRKALTRCTVIKMDHFLLTSRKRSLFPKPPLLNLCHRTPLSKIILVIQIQNSYTPHTVTCVLVVAIQAPLKAHRAAPTPEPSFAMLIWTLLSPLLPI